MTGDWVKLGDNGGDGGAVVVKVMVLLGSRGAVAMWCGGASCGDWWCGGECLCTK